MMLYKIRGIKIRGILIYFYRVSMSLSDYAITLFIYFIYVLAFVQPRTEV